MQLMIDILNWYLAIIICKIDQTCSVYLSKWYLTQSQIVNSFQYRYNDVIKYLLSKVATKRYGSLPSLRITQSQTERCSSASIQLSSLSLSHQFCWQWSSLLCLAIVLCPVPLVLGRPQGCILCSQSDLKGNDPSLTTYEEFRFEHQVTRQEAIQALRRLNYTSYEGNSNKFIIKNLPIIILNIIIFVLKVIE